MTHRLNILEELPLPVAPGKNRPQSAIDCLAHSAEFLPTRGSSPGLPSTKISVDESGYLITAERLGLSTPEWQKYRQEQGLINLHHDIWVSPDQPVTRALRAESLAAVAPADYLYRIRFSRLSAAWVLGYTPQFPSGRIDIDYSRDNRCNLPRAYRARFAAHQTTVIPYDCITIGPIRVTSPLRTAVDLVSYHDQVEHLDAVRAILRDPQNTVSPQLFLKALADKPNLRRSSYLRAQHLAQQCLKGGTSRQDEPNRSYPRVAGKSSWQT
ncbi:type IV toxin-antitoxin system AbiEi family antitoxin [Rothia sp. P5764]|uniref:type IV toxin-antitoxin system AbiEi family antitoxin n=1 Tax=Rothia sp. P5764 TaxID=3402654 RepID=UPI003ABE73A9